MIVRAPFLVLTLAAVLCNAVDHDLFKTCAKQTFCKELRGVQPQQPTTADVSKASLNTQKTVMTVPLAGGDNVKRHLEISLLQQSVARVKVIEDASKRYELNLVLDDNRPKELVLAEPAPASGVVTIKPKNDNAGTHSVIIKDNPLAISFNLGGDEKIVLDGTWLAMNHDEGADKYSFGFLLKYNNAKAFYGLHHHAYDLELPDTTKKNTSGYIMDPFRLRNSDTANYITGSPMALYGSVPVLYGHSEKSTSGIFLHNAAEQWVDLAFQDNDVKTAQFMVESGALDLFVMMGPTIKDVVSQFTALTGKPHMPQIWTLGYHQCRWSYMSQAEVETVLKKMQEHSFPLDAIWLDIDYTNGFRYFTWNDQTFPDPKGMMQKMKAGNDTKLVTIIDPHIKKDDQYDVYKNAKGKYFVRKTDGTDFEGKCWPGVSSYIDFLNKDARKYYADQYNNQRHHHDMKDTLAGIWNDMNEPSVFDKDTEWTMPFNLVHKDDQGKDVKHRDIHNIYGFLHTMSTHQGLLARDNGARRPFILTRSHFAGSQRYAIMWTGDNTADWDYLKTSYSECMLSNLVGLAFCGADVPGFFNNASDELALRWYQAGIWLPFYRGHKIKEALHQEPYQFPEAERNLIRDAFTVRYRHVPQWYTLFYEHTRTGEPVIRPLMYDYPGMINHNDHILLGSDILARPVLEKGAKTVDVYFPGDDSTYWYRVDDGSYSLHKGGNKLSLPVYLNTSLLFYKGGSIIVRRDRTVASVSEAKNHPLTVYVNCDKDFKASGRLYNDDGVSFEYEKNKKYLYVDLLYEESYNGTIKVIKKDANSDYTGSEVVIEKIIVNIPRESDTYHRREHETDVHGAPLDSKNIVHAFEDESNVLYHLRNEY